MIHRDETWIEWPPESAGHMDPEDAIVAWMRARRSTREAERVLLHDPVVSTQQPHWEGRTSDVRARR